MARAEERFRKVEEENEQAKEAVEDEETLRKRAWEIGLCGLGGASAAMIARSTAGGAWGVAAHSTFCFGVAIGGELVDPVLHEIFPEIW